MSNTHQQPLSSNHEVQIKMDPADANKAHRVHRINSIENS